MITRGKGAVVLSFTRRGEPRHPPKTMGVSISETDEILRTPCYFDSCFLRQFRIKWPRNNKDNDPSRPMPRMLCFQIIGRCATFSWEGGEKF